MSDLLARATRELGRAPVNHDRALLTLARLTHAPRRRSPRWIALVLPIAATLFALGAWADATQERSRATLAEGPAATLATGRARAPHRGVAVLLPPLPVAPATTAPRPIAPRPTATMAVAPRPIAPPPAVVASPPDPDALYRTAFEAYRDRDDARALVSWDAYLAAAGASGRFVPEARFGRALTLVRLGRKDEAKTALGPFARGDYGDYRRDQARALLGRL